LPKNSTLEVVDWWKYDEKALKKQDKLYFKFIKEKFKTYNHYEVFHYHIKQHANYNKLIKINSVNHETFMKENLKTFDIVFLDGTHTYETVYKELNYYKGTKVICGDDYDSQTHRPLVKAVNKFYKKNKKSYELIIDHESRFYIFKKK
jgi:hypothetical protein